MWKVLVLFSVTAFDKRQIPSCSISRPSVVHAHLVCGRLCVMEDLRMQTAERASHLLVVKHVEQLPLIAIEGGFAAEL